MSTSEIFVNKPAPGVPSFTPAQLPPSGTALDPQPDGKPIPKLFQPLRVRGVTFQNRIWVRYLSAQSRLLACLQAVAFAALPVLC